MCALLSGLYIRGDHEGGGGLDKEGKKCVFKVRVVGDSRLNIVLKVSQI